MKIVQIDNEICERCGGCVAVCPVNGLLMNKQIEVRECIFCGKCIIFCPVGAISEK